MIRIPNCLFTLLLACSAHAGVFAQTGENNGTLQSDSFSLRLRNAKHVGLSTDEKLSGYVLYVYPPDLRADNLASLAACRENQAELNAQMESLKKKRIMAFKKAPRTSMDEMNAITGEMNDLESKRPNSPFASTILLCDVLSFGVDYIELRDAENPEETVLIPISRVCKIIVRSAHGTKTSEPSVSQKPQ